MTSSASDHADIGDTVVDVTDNPAPCEYVPGSPGHSTAPGVVVDQDADHRHSGFRFEKTTALAAVADEV